MSEANIDPEVRAEIEAEFAELTAEIERINALPQTAAPEKAAMLEALRQQWRERRPVAVSQEGAPPWRRAFDVAIGDAVDGLLTEGLDVDLDGNIQFDLQSDSLKMHGQPVVDALLTGLQATLAERFPALGAATKAGVDPGRMFMAALLGGLEQVVSSSIKPSATSEDVPSDAKAAPEGGDSAVKMSVDFGGLIGALLKPPKPATAEDAPDGAEDDTP